MPRKAINERLSIDELMKEMNHSNLVNALKALEVVVGADGIRSALESVLKQTKVVFDDVKKDALSALDVDEREFFRDLNEGCQYGGLYQDTSEVASEMVLDAIASFKDDVKKLLAVSRDDDASIIIRALAAALRDSDSVLVEWAADYPDELADHLENCLKDGNPLKGFDF